MTTDLDRVGALASGPEEHIADRASTFKETVGLEEEALVVFFYMEFMFYVSSYIYILM